MQTSAKLTVTHKQGDMDKQYQELIKGLYPIADRITRLGCFVTNRVERTQMSDSLIQQELEFIEAKIKQLKEEIKS